MKNFLIKILYFLLPIIILFISVEIYIRNSPNSFITKANYLSQYEDKIEVLILGTSHSQNGINPKFFKENTCNLSYGSQDIQLDSALFFSNVKELKSLKKVVFELDYHRMDIENEKDFYRLPWYYLYYGIEIYDVTLINKISLYSSNTSFFNNIIENDLKGITKQQIINKYGFVEENYTNDFALSNYDSLKIVTSATSRLKNRHKEISEINFKNNKIGVESIIKYCNSHSIDFYLVSTPLYFTYRKAEIPKKAKKVDEYINYLVTNYNVKYFDFESDFRFSLKDFSNDDHLNAAGAEKYSKMIDSLINR